MSKKSVIVMPDTQKVLENMGEQIKIAILRRNLSTELVAERVGISRAALWAVEKGVPMAAIGRVTSRRTYPANDYWFVLQIRIKRYV